MGVGPQRAAAERRFRFELAAHPGSPAQARRLTRAWLASWSVCEDTCDTATLVVSELVTNAIVHTASSRVLCELHDGDDLVRIAVRDEGCAPGEPRPSPQRPDEEHGRGLLLVGALSRTWGTMEHGTGLLVWAELARGTDAAGSPAPDAPAPDSVAPDAAEPRDDLGWGARPKPGTPDEPDEGSRPGTPDDDPRTGSQGRTAAPDADPQTQTRAPHAGEQPPARPPMTNPQTPARIPAQARTQRPTPTPTQAPASAPTPTDALPQTQAEPHQHHGKTPDAARREETHAEAHHGTGAAWA
ncbi:ATP-binding protein [Streptomyces sp. NPDC090306]|uniref:ATP-binding protein n=1 Tax=Streptomyces sp. NPDC090306 TaxID=3365961 RepID=UPI00382A1586